MPSAGCIGQNSPHMLYWQGHLLVDDQCVLGAHVGRSKCPPSAHNHLLADDLASTAYEEILADVITLCVWRKVSRQCW